MTTRRSFLGILSALVGGAWMGKKAESGRVIKGTDQWGEPVTEFLPDTPYKTLPNWWYKQVDGVVYVSKDGCKTWKHAWKVGTPSKDWP